MDSADANAARLILAVLDEPAWQDDLPRLVVGSLARQRGGAWLTTTANLWGSLALDKFAAKFESVPVAGRHRRRSRRCADGGAPACGRAANVATGRGRPRAGARDSPGRAARRRSTSTQEGIGQAVADGAEPGRDPAQGAARAPATPSTRSVSAVEQKDKAKWSRGDVVRVRLEIDAQSDMTWVVVSDPVPGGATILGSAASAATRRSRRAASSATGSAWPAYEERGFEAFRSYYEYLPRGRHVVEYTVRLNNPGRFALPPTRVEAMYAPESFGEPPNPAIEVAP